MLDLGSSVERARFAGEFASRSSVPPGNIEEILLTLADQQARQDAAAADVREAPVDPDRLARVCLSRLWRGPEDGGRSLAHWRGEFHIWDGAAYAPTTKEEIRARVIRVVQEQFGELAATGIGDRAHYQLRVTSPLISDVIQSLMGIVHVADNVAQPAWLNSRPAEVLPQAGNMLATGNGLIDVVAFLAGRPHFYQPSPRFFTANRLDYDFVADAQCPRWLSVLNDAWPGDTESIGLLQEWFGYSLLPDTSQEKILLVYGPPRSSKGLIMRVLRHVLGTSNCIGPTLKGLSERFGLQPFLGKLLAIISDARLSSRHDIATIVERLLSISGEDAQTIDRKNLLPVTTRLLTRIVIVTNELPCLRDASGAITSRLLVFARTTRNWLGDEDPALIDDLLGELPGILIWSLEGLRRLWQRGHFVQPRSGQPLAVAMGQLASPLQAFLQDRCVVEPEALVPRTALYAQWERWCTENGIAAGGPEKFGRQLRAAIPTIEDSHPRVNGQQVRCYCGVGLREIGRSPVGEAAGT